VAGQASGARRVVAQLHRARDPAGGVLGRVLPQQRIPVLVIIRVHPDGDLRGQEGGSDSPIIVASRGATIASCAERRELTSHPILTAASRYCLSAGREWYLVKPRAKQSVMTTSSS
jgi:hypothetical protein